MKTDKQRETHRKEKKRAYERRKAQGLCPWCAKPAAPGHVYCENCLKRKTDMKRKTKDTKKTSTATLAEGEELWEM